MMDRTTILLVEVVVLAALLTFLYAAGRRIQRGRRGQVEHATCKPRVRIVARGDWIRHDGGPFPFNPSELIEVIFEGGGLIDIDLRPLPASYWPNQWWTQQASNRRYNIMFYRFARQRSVRDMPLTELPA